MTHKTCGECVECVDMLQQRKNEFGHRLFAVGFYDIEEIVKCKRDLS